MRFELSPEQLREQDGILKQFLDVAFDSSILLDKDGYVVNCGDGATQLTLTRRDNILGKHVTAFDKVSPFDEVLRTGVALRNKLYVIQGRRCLQDIYPIFWKGEVVGALGYLSYTNINDIRRQILDGAGADTKDGDTESEGLLRTRFQRNYVFEDFIGESPEILSLLRDCKAAAATDYPILLLGESGTGKEILASAIHSHGMKDFKSPYIKINCAAIPHHLFESELFGYEKGAFTGAISAKKGRLEAAKGGSVLFDEIGDMDFQSQGKLLRVLEEHEFERVGSVKTIPFEARIIASTNSDLTQKCTEGLFRQDLYYRLSAVEIRIPPLRRRAEDIPLLVSHFLARENLSIAITDEAMETMMSHSWPGNVRQLRNIVQRLGISCTKRPVLASDVKRYLPDSPSDSKIYALNGPSPAEAAAPAPKNGAQGREELLRELERHRYNVSAAARAMGISRATLYKRIKKQSISLRRTGQ